MDVLPERYKERYQELVDDYQMMYRDLDSR